MDDTPNVRIGRRQRALRPSGHAAERANQRSSDSSDHAEQIAIGVSQNNEVGIVGILPVDPLSAQGDQTLDLDLLIGLVVSPEVEVRPIFIIEVQTSAGCGGWHQERWVARLLLIAEGRRPERSSSIDV